MYFRQCLLPNSCLVSCLESIALYKSTGKSLCLSPGVKGSPVTSFPWNGTEILCTCTKGPGSWLSAGHLFTGQWDHLVFGAYRWVGILLSNQVSSVSLLSLWQSLNCKHLILRKSLFGKYLLSWEGDVQILCLPSLTSDLKLWAALFSDLVWLGDHFPVSGQVDTASRAKGFFPLWFSVLNEKGANCWTWSKVAWIGIEGEWFTFNDSWKWMIPIRETPLRDTGGLLMNRITVG